MINLIYSMKLNSILNLEELVPDRAFIKLELMRYKELIDNWYQLQRDISLQVNRHFILEHLN